MKLVMKHSIHIGTSGWSYKHWRNTFYPEELKVKDQFSYYLKLFDTVEINNTFYRLPNEETFYKWKENVPDDFIYVIKANRYITHLKRLRDPADSLARMLQRVSILDEKLGVILFQLPPTLKANQEVFEIFLEHLPKTYRYAFEFRNSDWYRDEIYELLKRHNCAFCIYELAGHQSPVKVTANFVYLRLHGPGSKYQGNYSDETLTGWANICKKWLKDYDVFVYFDNDEHGYAAFNALKLKSLM
jgi:uncharacterized protein YecE (DUF72 family)